jgi:hypothetical protein
MGSESFIGSAAFLNNVAKIVAYSEFGGESWALRPLLESGHFIIGAHKRASAPRSEATHAMC